MPSDPDESMQGAETGPPAAFKPSTRIGYLTSRYPAVSHVFVLREVAAVRAAGVDVVTYSVRRSTPDEILSEADREAFETTFAILPISPRALARAHVNAFRTSPGAYLRTLWRALRVAPPGTRALMWQLFYFLEAIVLWTRAHADSTDHLHAQFANVATDVAMLTAHFGRLAGSGPQTWSLTVHGPVEFFDVTSLRIAEKIRSARFATAISDFGRSQLMAQVSDDHWSQISVVHCGVDPDVFVPADAPDRDPGELTVLCVGRLTPHKGQAILLEALAKLRRQGLGVTVVFVGDGPDRASLERLTRSTGLGEHVTFTGAVGQDHIREWFRTADVFCLPSFAEGVPVVLMEAMAMQLPVVTTHIAGIRELVDDGVNGLLVPPGRSDLLADAIASLADDPQRRQEMGLRGREKVRAEYDVRRAGTQLAGIFREHAGRR